MRILVGCLIAGLVLISGRGAHAQETSDPWGRLAEWERAHVQRVLEERSLVPAENAYGRAVCATHVATSRVFDREDIIPMFFNVFHVTTRERTVRDALAFRRGEPFTELLWRDGERVLRNPQQYSVTLILPIEPVDPADAATGCVDVLVVTRDVWSLVLAWFVNVSGNVTGVQAAVVENNFLGRNEQLSLGFEWGLGSWSLGPTYLSPRFAGTRWQVYESFAMAWDRERDAWEGYTQSLVVSRPLFETASRQGWRFGFDLSDRIQRRFSGTGLRTYDAPETALDDAIEERWREQTVAVVAEATQSWGVAVKHNLSWGITATARTTDPLPYAPVDPVALASFEAARLPRSERAIGPELRWEGYRNRFMTVRNVRTFGVGEEVRLGFSTSAGLRYADPALGSTARFARWSAGAGYRWQVGSDGWVSARVDQSVRTEERPSAGVADLTTSVELGAVAPLTGFGRLIGRVAVVRVAANDANVQTLLGADTGLRGYPNGYLQGEHVLRGNLEWRTTSVEVLRTRLGLVFFCDTGSTWTDTRDFTFFTSVGFGARWMIPQFGTEVRSIDLGFPLRDVRWLELGDHVRLPLPLLSITFGQVFQAI